MIEFTDTELQLIQTALTIARRNAHQLDTRRRGPVVRLQSWFSWNRSSTAEKMDELIERISEHLSNGDSSDRL